MTELQKARIHTMRAQGISFAEISKQLDIPRETVKSFCRRSNTESISEPRPEKPSAEAGICRACGKIIEQTCGRKRRVFCCGQCRTNWWRENQDKIHRKDAAVYSFTCAGCGREFTAYGNQHRKYCSHDCYVRARFRSGGKDGSNG